MSSIKIKLPQNLDLPEIIKTDPPWFEYDIEKIYYILGLVKEIPGRKKDGLTQKGFTKINSVVLQSCIHDYSRYFEYLMENNILECDGMYIPGEKSKGYRYSEQYQTLGLKEIGLQHRNLVRFVEKRGRANQKEKNKHPYLAKWFNRNLTIDAPGAFQALEGHFQDAWEKHKENLLEMYHAHQEMIGHFQEQRFYFSVDEFAGRVHTNLTNIPKYLRQFISYKGHPLVSIDVVNCQPYLLNRVLSADFFNSSGNYGLLNITLIDPQLLEDRFRIELKRNKRPTSKKPHSRRWVKQQVNSLYQMISRLILKIPGDELAEFRRISLNGKFYEQMGEILNESIGCEITRDDIKSMIFQVLFSGNQWFYTKRASHKRMFAKQFPNIYEVLKAIKSIYKPHLACILQSMESEIILNGVVAQIERSGKDIPIWTIHDNIVTTTRWGDYVKQVMSSEFEKAIGYAPVISVEFWIPENKNAIRLQENADETLKLNSI